MSAPENRLIGDGEVERLRLDAVAVLIQHQHFDPVVQQLAIGTLALIRDRAARQELASLSRREGFA